VNLVHRRCLERARLETTSFVHDDVDPTELGRSLLRKSRHRFRVGHVDCQDTDVRPVLPRLCIRGAPDRADGVPAPPGKETRGGCADNGTHPVLRIVFAMLRSTLSDHW